MYIDLQKKHKASVKRNMRKLGVYKTEFEAVIDIYSGLLAQYGIMTERLIDNGFDIEVETERGGSRKSALATAHEKLRSDIIIYADRLMLNPRAFYSGKNDIKNNKKTNSLATALKEIEKGRDKNG